MSSAAPVSDPVYVRPLASALADTEENRLTWSQYRWTGGGDEWSEGWGCSDSLWAVTLRPRLMRLIPTGHVLEIAPGFGRITNYLRREARQLTVVDVTEKCIEHCKQRFAADGHIRYVVNDGLSLSMVESASIDLCVSWDSLVHCERATIAAYLRELARVLRPGGHAFLHHSNLGALAGQLSPQELQKVPGGRRASMSASAAVEDARAAGLRVLVQELIPWHDAEQMTDCLTLLKHDSAHTGLSPQVIERSDWREELAFARRMTRMYGSLAQA